MYKARAGNLLIFNPKHKSLTILLSYYGDVKDQNKWLLAQLGAFLVQNVTFYGSRDQCSVPCETQLQKISRVFTTLSYKLRQKAERKHFVFLVTITVVVKSELCLAEPYLIFSLNGNYLIHLDYNICHIFLFIHSPILCLLRWSEK